MDRLDCSIFIDNDSFENSIRRIRLEVNDDRSQPKQEYLSDYSLSMRSFNSEEFDKHHEEWKRKDE